MLDLYQQYRAVLDGQAPSGKIMPYGWGHLPNPLSGRWLPYQALRTEFARELANIVNEFTHRIEQLRAWSVVAAELTDEQKMAACREFIDPVAVVAMGLPYVIRSRFIFATAHLCHQANGAKQGCEWRDDLDLDGEIYFETAEKHGGDWRKFNHLKRKLEQIAGRRFQAATHNSATATNTDSRSALLLGSPSSSGGRLTKIPVRCPTS